MEPCPALSGPEGLPQPEPPDTEKRRGRKRNRPSDTAAAAANPRQRPDSPKRLRYTAEEDAALLAAHQDVQELLRREGLKALTATNLWSAVQQGMAQRLPPGTAQRKPSSIQKRLLHLRKAPAAPVSDGRSELPAQEAPAAAAAAEPPQHVVGSAEPYPVALEEGAVVTLLPIDISPLLQRQASSLADCSLEQLWEAAEAAQCSMLMRVLLARAEEQPLLLVPASFEAAAAELVQLDAADQEQLQLVSATEFTSGSFTPPAGYGLVVEVPLRFEAGSGEEPAGAAFASVLQVAQASSSSVEVAAGRVFGFWCPGEDWVQCLAQWQRHLSPSMAGDPSHYPLALRGFLLDWLVGQHAAAQAAATSTLLTGSGRPAAGPLAIAWLEEQGWSWKSVLEEAPVRAQAMASLRQHLEEQHGSGQLTVAAPSLVRLLLQLLTIHAGSSGQQVSEASWAGCGAAADQLDAAMHQQIKQWRASAAGCAFHLRVCEARAHLYRTGSPIATSPLQSSDLRGQDPTAEQANIWDSLTFQPVLDLLSARLTGAPDDWLHIMGDPVLHKFVVAARQANSANCASWQHRLQQIRHQLPSFKFTGATVCACGGFAWFGPVGSQPVCCSKCAPADYVPGPSTRPCTEPSCRKSACYGLPGQRPQYCAAHGSAQPGFVNVVSPVCAEPGCCVRPTYGPPGGCAQYCAAHGRQRSGYEDVANVLLRCRHPDGCNKQATYGQPGGDPEYCAPHGRQQAGYQDVRNQKCAEPGCKLQCSYGPPGGRAEYCAVHGRSRGYQNVRSRRCNEPGCSVIASFALPGQRPEYCAAHAKQRGSGYVNVQQQTCAVANCSIGASYGVPGGRPEYCAQHGRQKDGYVSLVKQPCSEPNCCIGASYGLPGGRPEYCAQHGSSQQGYVNLVKSRCGEAGCSLTASYGLPGQPAHYCAEHGRQRQGYINVVHSRCIAAGCSKLASYACESQRPEYCAAHGKGRPGYSSIARKCAEPGCGTSANFGPPEGPAQYCSQHSKPGCVFLRTSRFCREPGCPLISCYGPADGQPQYCSTHGKQRAGFVNLVTPVCANPGCQVSASYGLPGRRPVFCAVHGKQQSGYEPVGKQLCAQPGCSTKPCFGLPGGKPEYCAKHAPPGYSDVANRKCIHPGCTKQPRFGLPGAHAEYCAGHARQRSGNYVDVVTRRCAEPGCDARACCGPPGEPKQYCTVHGKPRGYVVLGKRCAEEGCSKQPTYGPAGSYGKGRRAAVYCAPHGRQHGYEDIVTQRCQHTAGCTTRPCWGPPGSKPVYCGTHGKLHPGCIWLTGKKKKKTASS